MHPGKHPGAPGRRAGAWEHTLSTGREEGGKQAGERTQPAQHQVHAARGEVDAVVLALHGEVARAVNALVLVHVRLAQRLVCARVSHLRTHFAGRQGGARRCRLCCSSWLADRAAAPQIGAPVRAYRTSPNSALEPSVWDADAGGAPC